MDSTARMGPSNAASTHIRKTYTYKYATANPTSTIRTAYAHPKD
jgi:hypothetical protein